MHSLDNHQQLLARARAGEAVAFAALVEHVAVRLLAFVQRVGGRALAADADAEDLLQTVLARAWRLLPEYEDRGPEAFYRWLLAITRHALSDRRKYLDAERRGPPEPAAGSPELVLAWSQLDDPATSIPRRAMRREAIERVTRALAALPPAWREVVERHLLAGETLREISVALGLSRNAVWERVHKGLAALREQIGSTP